MRPFPREAVRDLLGICRAMFAAKRDERAPEWVLEELKAIGEKLKLSLDLARKPPDTLGHRAALTHAEDACARLTRLIQHDTPFAPTLEAATIRVRRHPPIVGASDQRKQGGRDRH